MTRFVIIATVILAAVVFLLSREAGNRPADLSGTNLREAVGQDLRAEEARWGSHYQTADRPREFRFPDDHGPHDAFKLEWWYFTGNLASADGRHFGYQLTFFRNALAPAPTAIDSTGDEPWQTRQLYLAHFAVTDVPNRRLTAFERTARGAAGLAGASADPFTVWVDDWRVESTGRESFPVRLRASANDVEIDVTLDPQRPIVLQGEDGLSRKGDGPNQASYYYSITRLQTSGTIRTKGIDVPVNGLSWLDREWSTSLLGRTQVGWDWFSLQLNDGTDIMYFRLRESEAGTPEYASGVILSADGSRRDLKRDEIVVDATGWWTTSDGVSYPSGWTVATADGRTELRVEPYVEDQELNLSIRYWEGAVRVTGVHNGATIEGNGYVELTGYADEAARGRVSP